jgi:hypothetical protein
VHRALSYVLLNQRKHFGGQRDAGVDAFSSSAWFHGWDLPPRHRRIEAPVVEPSVWLLRDGWRRIGPIAPP